jgi:hypothetical protein
MHTCNPAANVVARFGVNATLRVQLSPAASVAGETGHVVPVTSKYAALTPVVWYELIAIAVWPVFVSTACCAALCTLTALVYVSRFPPPVAVRVAEVVAVPIPVPARLITLGEVPALLSIEMVPVNFVPGLPPAVGVKLTTTVQDFPGSSEPGKAQVPAPVPITRPNGPTTAGVPVKFSVTPLGFEITMYGG